MVSALKRTRTTCPDFFTPQVVLQILNHVANELAPKVARCKSGHQDLFVYNTSITPYDKQALYENRWLLSELLRKNETGVFRKTILEKGVHLRSEQAHIGQVLTVGRTPEYVKDQAYCIQHMLLVLKGVAKSAKTGVRLPAWPTEFKKHKINIIQK